MQKQNMRQQILNQNNTILSNIAKTQKTAKTNSIRSKGHILLSEASANGFKKVGWDVYQRPSDVDAGNIWSVETIENDKWLVCYTDANDQILRNLAKAAADYRMPKVAASIQPELGWSLNPGDLVEITPRQSQSFNYKYKNLKGEVTAALPDRTQLKFGDGSSMWFENKDLTPMVDAKEMEVGDEIRMFSRNLNGNITKISHDGNYVTFAHTVTGQEFTAKKNDVTPTKKSFMMMWTGDTPEDINVGGKALQNFFKSQQPQQESDAPSFNPPQGDKTGPPPAIKQNPSPQETGAGIAMPAADLLGGAQAPNGSQNGGGSGVTPGGMPAQPGDPLPQLANAASDNGMKKVGRRMNVGDQVQKKSTGEKGTIVDINFDRKLGKFYLIDFGSHTPEQVYDTDLMKLKHDAPPNTVDAMPMPTDITPGPTRLVGASIDPKYNPVKAAAREFVQGMLGQALTMHEQQYPGNKPTPELEQALTKQAIDLYMSKYMPDELRQVMGSEDKNALSEWLLFDFVGTKEDAPTASEMTPGENTVMPAQKTDIELAQEKIASHISSHIKLAYYTPSKFASPIEKNRFTHQAVNTLVNAGIDSPIAQLITLSSLASNSVDSSYLRHQLNKLGYSDLTTNQLIDEAEHQFATSIFTTTANQKYALDMPGMETLRGGGGGYPGGMDVDPMGWEVKSPTGDEQDPNDVQKSLEEQLMNQSQPFEESAPKINIELDQENKQIVIDYNQEEEPVMPIEGAEGNPPQPESPNMPSPSGPGGPKPGDARGPGGNETDFSNQDVPVNF